MWLQHKVSEIFPKIIYSIHTFSVCNVVSVCCVVVCFQPYFHLLHLLQLLHLKLALMISKKVVAQSSLTKILSFDQKTKFLKFQNIWTLKSISVITSNSHFSFISFGQTQNLWKFFEIFRFNLPPENKYS